MKALIKATFLFLAILLISGCGKKENSKEIEFLTNRTDFVNGVSDAAGNKDLSKAFFKILADKFKKETGITVKLTGYTDYPNAVRRRLASKSYGDVITLPSNSFTDKNIKTFFQPIGTKQCLSNYIFLDNCAIDDNVYGLPANYYLTGAVYNKKVFAEAGYKEFPKTLSELHDAFAKIKANGKIPIIINRGQKWPLSVIRFLADLFAGKAGAYNRIWSEDKPFSKDKPLGRAIYEMALWTNKGWTEPEFIADWEGSKTKVADGRAGMMFLGSWALTQIKERTLSVKCNPEDIDFAPLPTNQTLKDPRIIIANPGNPMLISKNTKNFEASKDWIIDIIKSGIFESQGGLPLDKNSNKVDKMFSPILKEINSGKIKRLEQAPLNAFGGEKTDTILKDMDIYSDYEFVGKPLDEARKSMKDYQECIDQMNKEFHSS